MGLETRNESSERPEQIEKAQEQDTIQSKRMELNDSDFDDVDKKANKSDLSEVSREKKDTCASEKEEDFSDVKENGQKDKVQEYPDASQEKHRIAAEDFAEPPNMEDIIMVDEPVGDDKSEKEVNQEEPDSQIFEDNTEPSLEIKETYRDNETSLDESKELDENENNAKDNEVPQENNNPEKLPKWYESLTEGQIETHKGMQEIAKEYVDKQPLSDEDKEELSDRQFEYLKNRNPEDRDDCRVLNNNAIDYVNENGVVVADYSKNPDAALDGAIKGSEHSEVICEGTILDRFGSNLGTYLSPLKENGEPYTIKERATGDRLIEPNIQDNSPYHKYIVNQDLSEKNIRDTIEHKYQAREISESDYEYFKMQLGDPELPDDDGYYKDRTYFNEEKYADNSRDKDMQSGIKTGIVASQFEQSDNPEGGAVQYIMHFTLKDMEVLILITEI